MKQDLKPDRLLRNRNQNARAWEHPWGNVK
jgi:hypothetical protein